MDAFNAELQNKGAFVFGGGLHDPATATVVRAENGDPIMTDGPFAQTKEQLGGFWIIITAEVHATVPHPRRCGGGR